MVNKVKQGKLNKAKGKVFEDKVYADLEEKGWIVSRWMKNVELDKNEGVPDFIGDDKIATFSMPIHKLVPAKPSIRMIPGKGPILVNSWTGFPDFVVIRHASGNLYYVEGVECKTNGYLSKEEKEKCKWLLNNNVFSKILIAKKKKNGRKIAIEYVEFR